MEYNTYCLWLYDERGEIIDNDNPPEWDDYIKLTNAFMAASDLYDSCFINNKKEFLYEGCSEEKKNKLIKLFANAMMDNSQ